VRTCGVVVTAGRASIFLEPLGTGKHFQGSLRQTEPVFTSRRMKCFVFSYGSITLGLRGRQSDSGNSEHTSYLHTERLSVAVNVIPKLAFLFLASNIRNVFHVSVNSKFSYKI
jgi:hypothetical protein